MSWARWMAAVVVVCLVAGGVWFGRRERVVSGEGRGVTLAGSESCRGCHERFYELWSTSHHGLAMRPMTGAVVREQSGGEVKVGEVVYRVEIGEEGGVVVEKGAEGEKRYRMVHVLGGKNVCYYLTELERGRLQVLPVAYDVRRKEWFDTQGSAVRHFHEAGREVLSWRDPAYTFNTSCYSCHVSQLSKNYDLASDTYRTTWAEPGINCETCHGAGGEHVRAAKGLGVGEKMGDVKLIVTRGFSVEQHNATCAPCHAKMTPITTAFGPGERYFDHYDLATLEDADFYPDGRDLGENYTYTSWRMSGCVQSGRLSCVHCHTSSGRYRFATENPNGACMPCHEKQVKDPASHTHHQAEGVGGRCVSCHMPMTEFARMRRSDHSMRPPAPAATVAFKSPNACNGCHGDRDAGWADGVVRGWHEKDYQAGVLHRAGLLAAARNRDWARLGEMLEQITGKGRDEVYATSFIRLLGVCEDGRKWGALREAMKDASPLVRAAAAAGLAGDGAKESVEALLAGTGDAFRLVRIRAAGALAGYPREMLSEGDRKKLEGALRELEASFEARPDDWSAHYNRGAYWADQNQLERALGAYEVASRLRPDVIQPWVNASLIYARKGEARKAEGALGRALAIDGSNAAANYNMGLLQAELGDAKRAEGYLRAALKADGSFAEAAYNLGVLVAGDRPKEGLEWLRKAYALRPEEGRYGYTLAFYLNAQGNAAGAVELLRGVVGKQAGYGEAWMLWGAIHEERGELEQARGVYRQALANGGLSGRDRVAVERRLGALMGR